MTAYNYRPVYLAPDPLLGSRYLLGVVVEMRPGWLHVLAPWEYQPSPLRPTLVRCWERCRARVGSIQSFRPYAPGEIGPYCVFGPVAQTPDVSSVGTYMKGVMS